MSSRLIMRGITKSFGGIRALGGVDFEARAGEIIGLAGENGAGKSTLLKVLSGVYPAGTFGGEIEIDGVVRRFGGAREAERAGVAIVHQELMQVAEMTVAENLVLGREPGRGLFVDPDLIELEARHMLERFGCGNLDPRARIGSLGIGVRQLVEVVRALALEARILILDEPTAALTGGEAARLHTWLRQLRTAGTTCIYVSHRMDEIFSLCDRIAVLRDGRSVATLDTPATTPAAIVSLMVGREVTNERARRGRAQARALPRLTVTGLGLEVDGGRRVLDDLAFQVRPGEVLALAGAMGSGRTATLSTLFGAGRGRVRGTVTLDRTALDLSSPRAAVQAGVALVPEDRKGAGLVGLLATGENLILPPRRGAGWRGWLYDPDAEEAEAARRGRTLQLRGRLEQPVATLSGGNQQKVVIGKWLDPAPLLLLLDEPTRGVDVGAKEEIYALIDRLAQEGVAVVFASSDLPELLRLADRILVLRAGRVVGELDGTTATAAQIVTLSAAATTPTAPPAAWRAADHPAPRFEGELWS